MPTVPNGQVALVAGLGRRKEKRGPGSICARVSSPGSPGMGKMCLNFQQPPSATQHVLPLRLGSTPSPPGSASYFDSSTNYRYFEITLYS